MFIIILYVLTIILNIDLGMLIVSKDDINKNNNTPTSEVIIVKCVLYCILQKQACMLALHLILSHSILSQEFTLLVQLNFGPV